MHYCIRSWETWLTSQIASLDPKLENGVLRVGGRLVHADLDYDQKYPVILPNKDPVVDMIIDNHRPGNRGGSGGKCSPNFGTGGA